MKTGVEYGLPVHPDFFVFKESKGTDIQGIDLAQNQVGEKLSANDLSLLFYFHALCCEIMSDDQAPLAVALIAPVRQSPAARFLSRLVSETQRKDGPVRVQQDELTEPRGVVPGVDDDHTVGLLQCRRLAAESKHVGDRLMPDSCSRVPLKTEEVNLPGKQIDDGQVFGGAFEQGPMRR